MNQINTLLERNKQIAARDLSTGKLQPSLAEALPLVKTIVIGCADMRVDPAHILGLEPGEAVVMRNIGGRITPGLLAQLGMLGQIGQTEGKIPGGGDEFHVVVLQRTDCGIKRLAQTPSLLADYFQVEETELASKSVLDPKAAVASDVEVLRTVSGLPGDWFVSGLVYDVQTGLVDTVVAPTAISA